MWKTVGALFLSPLISKLVLWLTAAAAASVFGYGLLKWGQQGHQKAVRAAAQAEAIATQRDAAQSALEAYKRDQEKERLALQRRLAREREALREAQRQNKELSDALKNSPEWADDPIPDSVRNAITGAEPGKAAAKR